MTDRDLLRFFAKVDRSGDANACWTWTASRTVGGYSCFYLNGKLGLGHRAAYEHWVGDIQPGLDLDHLCRNRACVNPAHLEAVTRQENLRRGLGAEVRRRFNAEHRRDTCVRGHALDDVNLRLYFDKKHNCYQRMCRSCERERGRIRTAQKVAA